ncbi:hypothetical protein P9112_007272 [Eukaryota sp. TZLM1-RC]
MSLVASGTPNSVQIQLYYYLVFGARRFGATTIGLLYQDVETVTRWIPESIIPFLGDAKNNLFSVELAEQVAQYSAAQLFKIREQVLELLDVLESTFLKKLNCFVISLGKRTSSEAALSSDANEAFKRVAAAEDTQHTD